VDDLIEEGITKAEAVFKMLASESKQKADAEPVVRKEHLVKAHGGDADLIYV